MSTSAAWATAWFPALRPLMIALPMRNTTQPELIARPMPMVAKARPVIENSRIVLRPTRSESCPSRGAEHTASNG